MAIASITSWLDDPKRIYKVGLLLYEQYGENKVTLALLRNGSGSYHLTKLIAALTEINKNVDLVPKQIVFNDPQPVAHSPNTKTSPDFTNAPDKIQQIRDEKTRRYAQARRLFETIRVMDSAEHRLQAGLELLDHMDFVSESWAVIDEWAKNGKVREIKQQEIEKAVDSLTLAELMQESRNIPTYISKDKSKLLQATKPKDQLKYNARIDERQRRLKQVLTRLQNAVQ